MRLAVQENLLPGHSLPEKFEFAVAAGFDGIELLGDGSFADRAGELQAARAAYGMFSRKLPPFTPPRGAAEDRAVLVDALSELGEHAAAVGAVVLLEPLNRYV